MVNKGGSHWCCYFIFNLREFIIRFDSVFVSKSIDLSIESNEEYAIPGYMFYNPFNKVTNFKMGALKDFGIAEFLSMIYNMNWLVSKYTENPDQISLLNLFDDLKAEYEFYNFKLEDQCVPNQVDGWNCGIGTSLTIMRFSTFMNRF